MIYILKKTKKDAYGCLRFPYAPLSCSRYLIKEKTKSRKFFAVLEKIIKMRKSRRVIVKYIGV